MSELPKCRFCKEPVGEGFKVGESVICEECRRVVAAVVIDAFPSTMRDAMNAFERSMDEEPPLEPL